MNSLSALQRGQCVPLQRAPLLSSAATRREEQEVTAPRARLGKVLTDETLRFETIVSALAMAVAVHLLGARLDEQPQ